MNAKFRIHFFDHWVCAMCAALFALTFSPSAAVFPLKVHSSQRYLIDQRNDPFLIQGEAPWSLIIALTTNEVNLYLADRHAKGVNLLVVNLIEHQFAGGDNPYAAPTNRYSQRPFLTPGDFTTPNEAYFAYADWVLHRCAEEGFAVLLTPCYLGYPGTAEGWYNEVIANGTNKCRIYGQYLGQRYQAFSNIVWLAGGDRNPDSARPGMLAVANGIRQFATNNLWTAHCFPENSAADQYEGEPWLALNTTYTYNDTYLGCLDEYAHTPLRPTFLIETHYENDFGGRTGDDTRRQAWWAVLAGSCGQVFGNRPLWLFDTGWTNALNTVGAISQVHLREALLSRPWEQLVPETGVGLVIGGLGTGSNHRTAARTANGSAALVYLPQGGSVNIDCTRISGSQIQAWWFNPRTGVATNLGLFPVTGSQAFTAPDSLDWVLALDDSSRNFPPPGARDIHLHNFTNWISNFPSLPLGQRGWFDDFDGDHLNNLAEYVFVGDPTTSNPELRPSALVISNHLELTIPFNFTADDIIASVERATVLTTPDWVSVAGVSPSGGWTNIAEIALAQGTNTVRIMELLPANESPGRFFRLRFGLAGY
jgi:Protein of unknown function (DUF4038)/Putative collagen-binding domain of a collagenase